ncbi:radical SAM protein [Patescibacteria group bacterium]|nr:radical SAM protein [Patescibacteria group bacterium]
MVKNSPTATNSICPKCLKNIPADIVKEAKKILLKKHCPVHGGFEDIYWSDSALYDKYKKFACDGEGASNPNAEKKNGCPLDCGLCADHKTGVILANIDLTNRCNQKCPICFANSAASGYLYEPSFQQVKKMLEMLRRELPAPCEAVQFSGGEPTLHPDFIKIVELAKKMGFAQIQVATNGIRASQDLNFCEKMAKAGINTIYFQFDGVKKETYQKTRGHNALPIKLKALENFRLSGLDSIALVPTIIKGVNDDQIGDIIDFAKKNSDIITTINFQPISFSGRIDRKELTKQRITIPDVLNLIEKQTNGQILKKDFYPIPFVAPISSFTEAWKKSPQVKFTIHPHCGAATYVYIRGNKLFPIARFIDVEKFLNLIKKTAANLSNHGFINRMTNNDKFDKAAAIAKITNRLPELIKSKMPSQGVKIGKSLLDVIRSGSSPALKKFHRDTLFIGIMHFMDPYNFDIERVKRCGIHYITPNMKIIPFCAYNIFYREKIEKLFSKPLRK